MKVLAYGVRPIEKPFFEEANKEFGYELKLTDKYLTDAAAAELAEGCDAVILRANCKANKENLDIFKKLGVKYVVTRTAGFNHIDVNYANSLGYTIGYVPAYSPNSIAELGLTMAMTLLRHTAYANYESYHRDFVVDDFMFSKLIHNCTVGIIGLGRIGRSYAQMFHGLGAKVIGSDIFQIKGIEDYCTQVSQDEVLAQSDIVVLQIAYKVGMPIAVTKEFVAKMKDGAILINCARGELMDVDAVLEGIKSGKLGGLALDVLPGEGRFFAKNWTYKDLPDPKIAELVNLYPRVLVTPHIGSFTDESVHNMALFSYKNIKQLAETGTCDWVAKL